MPKWAWVLIIIAGGLLLVCGGAFGIFAYLASNGPETHVYAGNEVPAEYVNTAKSVGLLEPGEQIRFFYSDALRDIRDGFYFVSDRKVAVYKQSAARPATAVKFSQIQDVAFEGSDSEWSDGSVTLTLKDGSTVGFPISSEQGRDKLFVKAIQDSLPKDKR